MVYSDLASIVSLATSEIQISASVDQNAVPDTDPFDQDLEPNLTRVLCSIQLGPVDLNPLIHPATFEVSYSTMTISLPLEIVPARIERPPIS